MSADNGVYIGRWQAKEGMIVEYRVIYAAAIDNCDYDSSFPESLTDSYVVEYFGQAKSFSRITEARVEAERIMTEVNWTEYGICQINFDRPFPQMTMEEAKQVKEVYWQSVGK